MGTPITGRETVIGLKKASKAAAGSTTVDDTSAAGQKVLKVAATTNFAVGETVKIGVDTPRLEHGVIASIQAGVSLTLHNNLQYEHTGVQADPVTNEILWRYAHPCGANDGILILSETLKQTREHHKDDSAGLPFFQRTDPGKINAGGDIRGYLRYEGLDCPIALVMGAAGEPTQQSIPSDWVLETAYNLDDLCKPTVENGYRYKVTDDGTSGSEEPSWPMTPGETVVDGTVTWACEVIPCYANSYKLTTDLDGLFATIALLKKSDIVYEYPSAKIHGFTISGEMNAPLSIAFNAIANLQELASTINTSDTVANITYPDKGNRIIFNADATFKINDESDGALDDGDKIYPASFELSFNRPMEGDLTAEGEDINELDGTGEPEITLKLSFPQYNDVNHQFFTDWNAFTRKKLEIYFKGTLIDGTDYYEFKLSFPNLKIADPEAQISGAGKVPASIPFVCLGTDSAPTGMIGITQPFQIDVQNTRSTDPLG